MVRTRSAPATVSMSATSRAVIGTRAVLLVRTAVRVVGHDRGDAPGAGPLEGVDHDQQLHDRVVHRAAGGLNQEHVLLADVLEDPNEDVLVLELEDVGLPIRVPR